MVASSVEHSLSDRAAALKAELDAMPGAVAESMSAARGSKPLVLIYKIMGKMFAILSLRAERFVILKCDPYRAELLRETYEGVGHRSHLDRRYWVSVDLESDVPIDEIRGLVAHSWDQVAATLTRKQKEELASLSARSSAAEE